MNEQPLFYQGQKVVALSVTPDNTWYLNPKSPQPIDGKTYYVSNPNADLYEGVIFITIVVFGEFKQFWQGQFVPYEDDLQREKEISNALNENLKIKI